MKCPICDNEMCEGGLIIDGVVPGWVPMEQFRKKGIRALVRTGLRKIGKTNVVLGETKVSNAYCCENCNKIIGIFDITDYADY